MSIDRIKESDSFSSFHDSISCNDSISLDQISEDDNIPIDEDQHMCPDNNKRDMEDKMRKRSESSSMEQVEEKGRKEAWGPSLSSNAEPEKNKETNTTNAVLPSNISSTKDNVVTENGEEKKICRICFEEGDSDDLTIPCQCKGSQLYAHIDCIKQWQLTVMLGGSNHPCYVKNEERHKTCNVCKTDFQMKPLTRLNLMENLADFPAEKIVPGLVCVHEKPNNLMTDRLPLVLRALVESKHIHFKESVYLMYAVEEKGSKDGEDKILGINLVRPMDTDFEAVDPHLDPRTKLREEDLYDEVIKRESEGMQLFYARGGPCRLPVATAMALYQDDEIVLNGSGPECVHRVKDGETEFTLMVGELRQILQVPGKIHTLLVFHNRAEWSRAQLLGEIARGSWGTTFLSEMETEHKRALVQAKANWSFLFEHSKWAPANKLQEERVQVTRDAERINLQFSIIERI